MAVKTYYDEPLKDTLASRVQEVRPGRQGFWHAFPETLFYPEGGGMLRDRGTVNGCEVRGLKKEGGQVWHLLEAELSGPVCLKIDLGYRLRRIQAHSAQHLVSGLFIDDFGIDTFSHHYLSDGCCDLDLKCESLTAEQAARIEGEANQAILQDLPYLIHYLDAEAAAELAGDLSGYGGLEAYRMVEIPGIDKNLCGCPQVPSARYLRGVVILGWQKIAGGTRLVLAAGERLLELAKADHEELVRLGSQLSAPIGGIGDALEHLKDTVAQSLSRGEHYRIAYLELLAARARGKNGFIGEDYAGLDIKDLQFLASRLCAGERTVAALSSRQDDGSLAFIIAKSGDLPGFSAGELMKSLRSEFGVRGGGNQFAASGSAAYSPELAEAIRERAAKALAG